MQAELSSLDDFKSQCLLHIGWIWFSDGLFQGRHLKISGAFGGGNESPCPFFGNYRIKWNVIFLFLIL